LKGVNLRWLLQENSSVTIANIHGSYLTEQVDRKAVLPAKVATFKERKRIEDMKEGVERGEAGVVVEPNKTNNEGKTKIAEGRKFLKISLN
jgi:hypothetical protein